MDATLVATRAILLVLDAARMRPFVLRGGVIPHFADGTLQRDNVPHCRRKIMVLNFLGLLRLGIQIPQHGSGHELEASALRTKVGRDGKRAVQIELKPLIGPI